MWQIKAPFSWSRLFSLLILAVVWFGFIHPVASNQYSFAIWADNEYLLAPVLAQTSQILRDGEWPLWINSILGGFPIYNFTQLSAYYPFYGTIFPIFSDPFEASRSMHWLTLAHMFVFLLNSFVLLRVIGLGRAAAVAGASLMVFNYNMLLYSGWLNIVAPYAWLPLFLAGVIRLLIAPNSLRAFVMCLVPIVLLTAASPSQPLIHAVLLSGIIVLAHSWHARSDRALVISGVSQFVVVGLFAMALCAPIILPALREYPQMIRWLGAAHILGHEKIPFEHFTVDQMAIKDLVGVLFALERTPAVGNPLIGLIPVLLAVFAFARRAKLEGPQRWLVWPIAILAVYALLSACGSNSGMAYINYHLPLINQIREPTRFLVLAHLSVAILAAIGLGQVPGILGEVHNRSLSSVWRRPELRYICFILLIGLLVALFAPINKTHSSNIWLPLCFGAILLVLLWRGLPGPFITTTEFNQAALAGLVILMQFVLVPWRALPITAMDVIATQKVELLNALKRVSELDPEHRYRVIFEGDIDKAAAGMLASYYQVRNFNAYINPAPAGQFNDMYYHGARGRNYYAAMGAKYLICSPCTPENTKDYSLLEQHRNYGIYQTTALPRFYFATKASAEYTDLVDYQAKVASAELGDYPVFTPYGSWLSDPSAPAGSEACMHSGAHFGHNQLRLAAQCSHDALLVLNEFDNGNWRASINGKKARLFRVNGNQIGIVVNAGTSLIEVRYQPRNLRYALWIAVLGAISLFAYLAYWHRKRNLVIH